MFLNSHCSLVNFFVDLFDDFGVFFYAFVAFVLTFWGCFFCRFQVDVLFLLLSVLYQMWIEVVSNLG